MTTTHTPGPWYIARRLGPASAPIVLMVALDPIGTSEADYAAARGEIDANAARIVACVNACAGINPEAVPKMLEALKLNYLHTDDRGRTFCCGCPRFAVLSADCSEDRDDAHATGCREARAALALAEGKEV